VGLHDNRTCELHQNEDGTTMYMEVLSTLLLDK
jgi:hypothetical protein